MKNTLFVVILVVLSVFAFSCASVDIPQPDWVTNYRNVFPESDYITQRATGSSAEDAQEKATQAIAEFFSTGVESQRLINQKSIQLDDGTISESLESSNVVSVTSNVNLVALETEEPWYDKASKTWYALSHVERKTAWEQYEPTVRLEKDNFYSFYDKAKSESEPILRIRYYSAALQAGKEFVDALSYAQFLSKSMTDNAFSADMLVLSSVKSEQQKEKLESQIFISVDTDSSNTVYAAVNNVLTSCGFNVTKDKAKSAYVATVNVQLNTRKEEDMLVMNPSITINLTGPKGSVYSYADSASKILSYDLEVGKKKACTALAKVLNENLQQDFNATLSGNK